MKVIIRDSSLVQPARISEGDDAVARESEFREIAHSGGSVTISFKVVQGLPRYSQTWRHCRPGGAAIFAVWALAQGVPVAQSELGGLGQAVAGPPMPGCIQVFVGSDSEGFFGRECPRCRNYWRSWSSASICPYCMQRGNSVLFLTQAQRSYIAQYCAKFRDIVVSNEDCEFTIDMDAVADAAGACAPKPPFYYAEQTQQNKFTCTECGSFNDVLGTYCYCSVCGTRNNLQDLTEKVLPLLRRRINDDHQYEGAATDAVGIFDSFVGSYVKELVEHIPLTEARKKRLGRRAFHNLTEAAAALKEIFDIDILSNVPPETVAFATKMFCRRHVYEHNGGEADQRYIDESGDTSVRLREALRESQESAHRIVGVVHKMASNLHHGFSELIKPNPAPISWHKQR